MEENELFEKVTPLFMRYGVKSMTMDEIARQIGISKKTLYLYVDNKKDLVKKMMQRQIEWEQCLMAKAFTDGENAIDEIMSMSKQVSNQIKGMHPSVLFDIKKYHPEAFQIMVKHKDKFIRKCIQKNLENGIKEGYYRTNFVPEIITNFYLFLVGSIMDPENHSNQTFNFHETHSEMMRYHIRGIASAKGREYLKTKFKQDNV